MSLDWQKWINTFQTHYAEKKTPYNDARDYGIAVISPVNANWRVIGVHHLTGDENQGRHHIFIRILCKQNDIDPQRVVNWSYADDTQIFTLTDDKIPPEIKDQPIFAGQRITLKIQGGDTIGEFHTSWPDEWGHHSYFVCFQEIDPRNPPQPPPPPLPDPDPPPTNTNSFITILDSNDKIIYQGEIVSSQINIRVKDGD